MPAFDQLSVYGTEANDAIIAPADYLNLAIHGQGGNDTLTGGAGHDALYGGVGNDKLYGKAGNDLLEGGEGNDNLYGEAGDDVLDGGAGDDYLEGGAGSDTFIYGKGYGHDTVSLYDAANGKRDIVRLKDLTLDEVEFKVTVGGLTGYHHVIITIKETGETLTLQNALHSQSYQRNYSLQAIEFGDGTVMEWAALEASGRLKGQSEGNASNNILTAAVGVDTALSGHAGNDTLTGGSGSDVLDGGSGDDILFGGAGHDVYVFGRGYGNDRVILTDDGAGKRDMVRLIGLSAAEVTFFKKPLPASDHLYDVFIRINDTGELLILERALGFGSPHSIQAVEFGDGSVIEWRDVDWENIGLFTMTPAITGTAGNDALKVNGHMDTVLYGQGGNDTLTGGAGNDILDGGAGNDALTGGAGNDTYVFGRGYGHDTVNASDTAIDKREAVRLLGLTADEVELLTVRAGSYHSLIIRIKDSGETLTVTSAVSSSAGFNSYGIQALEFGDGTVLEWSELESSGRVLALGTAAVDTVVASRLHTDLYGYEGNDNLSGGAGDDRLYGGDGNDTLNGNAGNDILDGGRGDDSLNGGSGDDTYILRLDDGRDIITNTGGGNDLLKFADLDPAELWFGKSGNHLLIGLVGTTGQVTVNNWYTTSDYKIDTIEAGNSYLVESQVAQLVQAMAAIGAPGGAGGQWTEEQRESLTPVLSAYWQPRA